MRIAVIFFGLARAVPLTIGSIRRNIYDCNAGLSLYTIASLNIVQTLHNPRAGEAGISLDPADAFQLKADTYLMTRQDDAAIATALAAVRARRDVFENKWASVTNALHQLVSLQRAWHLCAQANFEKFDYFLFVRPDLIYLDEIKISEIVSSFEGSRNIALPAWHSFGGFNDRFALADAAAAQDYASRLSLIPEYCAKHDFHPETFLSYALASNRNKVCELPVRAQRARSTGSINKEDFSASVIDLPRTPRLFSLAPRRVYFSPKDTKMMDSNDQHSADVIAKLLPQQLAGAPVALRRVTVDGFPRVTTINGMPYINFLKAMHTKRKVNRYLEIGTQYGRSLELAHGKAVAIDPKFLLDKAAWAAKPGMNLYETTSDAFFLNHDPRDILGGEIELAFIDGMHLSDFVLRDFVNVERYCSNNAMIVLHDALPQNFEMTERDRRTEARRDKPLAGAWTGDVWRVVPILKRERPDLRIQVLDCVPTGLVLIDNLNPSYRMPADRLDELLRELTASEPAEPEFWGFIESLPVLDSWQMH